MRYREVEVGLDERRLQGNCTCVMGNRLAVASSFPEREAKAVMRERRLPPELHGGAPRPCAPPPRRGGRGWWGGGGGGGRGAAAARSCAIESSYRPCSRSALPRL